VWMGDGKRFMVFPVRGGTLLNYVGFVPTETETVESWLASGNRDELAASFQGWDASVTALLEKVETCFWWGLYDRRPLASWTNGRLALLGDAAHAMLRHLGQGANQAIEDGGAPAVLLERCAHAEVPAMLKRYEELRRVRTNVVQAEARQNGLRYDSKYASLDKRDHEIRNAAELRKWLYDYDVEKAAIASLRNAGAVTRATASDRRPRPNHVYFLISAWTSTTCLLSSISLSALSAARPQAVSCSPLPPLRPMPPTT
jgi:salicylate hydroxylase